MSKLFSIFAWRSGWRAALLVFVLMGPARAAGAQSQVPGAQVQAHAEPPLASEPPPSRRARSMQRREALLQAGLEELARLDAASDVYTGLAGIVAGGLGTTYAFSVALDGDELGQSSGRAALAGVSLAAGLVMIARGVHTWVAADDVDVERLQRFATLRTKGALDAENLARFEGELAAAAAVARAARIAGGISALATASAGGVLLALGASSQLEGSAQHGAYIFGGTLLGLGLLEGAVSLLRASPHERVFERYQGLSAAEASPLVRISITPVVTAEAFALRASALF